MFSGKVCGDVNYLKMLSSLSQRYEEKNKSMAHGAMHGADVKSYNHPNLLFICLIAAF